MAGWIVKRLETDGDRHGRECRACLGMRPACLTIWRAGRGGATAARCDGRVDSRKTR
jgi:hypothetical protein